MRLATIADKIAAIVEAATKDSHTAGMHTWVLVLRPVPTMTPRGQEHEKKLLCCYSLNVQPSDEHIATLPNIERGYTIAEWDAIAATVRARVANAEAIF